MSTTAFSEDSHPPETKRKARSGGMSANQKLRTPKKRKIKEAKVCTQLHLSDDAKDAELHNLYPGKIIFDGCVKIPLDLLSVEDKKKHEANLTITLTGKNWTTKERLLPVKAYHYTKHYMVLPRHYAVGQYGTNYVQVCPTGLKLSDQTFLGELDEGRKQVSALSAIMDNLNSKYGCAQLCLPPGYGKTITCLKAISLLGMRAMMVAHTGDLCDQLVEAASKFLPGTICLRLEATTPKERLQAADIVVFTIQSYLAWIRGGRNILSPFSDQSLSQFGTFVMDESHHFNALQFCSTIPTLMRPFTIALSGTPSRRDGSHLILAAHIGKISFEVAREYSQQVIVKILTPLNAMDDVIPATKLMYDGSVNLAAMTNELCTIEKRNNALAEAILYEARTKRMLCLSGRVEHLYQMAELCKLMDPSADVGVVAGKVKKAERLLEREKRIVFATYSLYTEGMDDPTLGGIALLTPKGDVKQAVARVMRGKDFSAAPVILDVKDVSSVWNGMYYSRIRLYNKEKYAITNWTDATIVLPDDVMMQNTTELHTTTTTTTSSPSQCEL